MKWLIYQVSRTFPSLDENRNPIEKTVLTKVKVKDDDEGRALAASEAIGDIVEYDDGKPEYKAPTQLDIIEAQVTYTAMMTDTLLED